MNTVACSDAHDHAATGLRTPPPLAVTSKSMDDRLIDELVGQA
ncbi:hypothetical protein QFZ58_006742 [Streptomyces sp. B1I3]|nr:hypothetical protein [Streptomyces sp. B1I3]